jgi:prevent-host-death family protein
MNTAINVHDMKTNYSKYLDRVIRTHREVVLSKYGKPVAKLVPFTSQQPRQLGGLKGKLHMSSDFDEPMMELWDIT